MTSYLKSESMYIPTPPAERGVGTYSKLYPVMFGLKSISFEFVILVSVTPMTTLGWLTVSDETKKPPKTLETSPKTSEQIKRFQGSSKLTKQTSEAGRNQFETLLTY